ncbi:MAG: DUF2071 domain-containing protein [Pirellulaceae bacterium]|nr:DUF2071 domain-containing protein [Pirellulaceae bacterium]
MLAPVPVTLDRLAPTRRPLGRPTGYQLWRSLLFLHWAVPGEALRKVVPESLELDLHDGVAYVGLVPFAMQGVRPAWWPAGTGLRFLETNVRTYVHRDGQPGVYFLSLDAASRLAVVAARIGWSLPYYHARMQLRRDGDRIHYESRRGGGGPGLQVTCRPGPLLGPSPAGTLEHFFLERYLLFVQRRGKTLLGQVHHEPYPARRAEVLQVRDELIAAAGLPAIAFPPDHVHYCDGVDVEIFGLRPVR